MKVKVIKKFIDKETKKLRPVGSEFECSESRFKEIQSVGNFVEVVKTKK